MDDIKKIDIKATPNTRQRLTFTAIKKIFVHRNCTRCHAPTIPICSRPAKTHKRNANLCTPRLLHIRTFPSLILPDSSEWIYHILSAFWMNECHFIRSTKKKKKNDELKKDEEIIIEKKYKKQKKIPLSLFVSGLSLACASLINRLLHRT